MQRILLILCLVFTLPIFNTLHAQCDGGEITTDDGATTAYACVNDGEDDFVSFFNNSLALTDYAYVITDANNVILGITENSFADFENAGLGDCRIFGLSFTGDLVAAAGDDVTMVDLATGCFDLTENFITVIRRELQESEVMLVSDGENNLVTIDNNDNAMVTVTNLNGLSENYTYILQRTNGKIIAISEAGVFDLATQVPGTYFIFGYQFSGDILLIPGNNISGNMVSSGCVVKSSNFVTIDKSTDSSISGCLAEGATVLTQDGETTAFACVGNRENDFIGFDNTSIAGVRYQYIITDENNIILGLPEGGFANFENIEAGDCRVWGLSFQGNLTAEPGDELNTTVLSDICFDLSDNFITVIRRQTEETEVSLSDSSTNVTINDNAAASFDFINNGDNDANFVYVVTRDDDRIIAIVENSFDFAFEEPGKYFVFGYSFIGEVQFSIGMSASGLISNGCSEKSDNFIFVRKNTDAAPMTPVCTADAGILTTEQAMVTLSGGVANIVATPEVNPVTPTGFDRVFVLTSGPEKTIIMISPASLFTVTQPGDYQIHTLIAELNDPGDPNFFDGSEIIPGVSTAEDITAAIEAQEVCADFDMMGVQITVFESTVCEAVPGVLFANPSEVPQQFLTFIFADILLEPMVPAGYEVTYFLALGPERTIVQTGPTPAFVVEEAGDYNIFMLVAETTDDSNPNFFDLNFVVPGVTTFEILAFLLDISGVCAGLDELGANITVTPPVGSASTRTDDDQQNNLSIGEFEMTAYPNPAIDQLTLRYQLAENQSTDNGRFQIVDFTGKVVRNGVLPFEKGLNEWQFTVEDLPAGSYFIRVVQSQLRITTPFLKVY